MGGTLSCVVPQAAVDGQLPPGHQATQRSDDASAAAGAVQPSASAERADAQSAPPGPSAYGMYPTPWPELLLGRLIGRGSYGRVHVGLFCGREVAIKIITNPRNLNLRCKDGMPLEAVITAGLAHRNIIATLAHFWTSREYARREVTLGGRLAVERSGVLGFESTLDPGGGEGLRGDNATEDKMWLVMDYCDRGCLLTAIEAGSFMEVPGDPGSGPCLPAVLGIAADIAAGMAFLHGRKILHGDLTCNNVLLSSSPDSPCHCYAKVGDFGLAREIAMSSKWETQTFGTVTHMAPGVLYDGCMSRAGCVYSFGVVLWELLAGSRAWSGMNHAQVMIQVGIQKARLPLLHGAPAPLQALVDRCTAADPALRPTFMEIGDALAKMLAGLPGGGRPRSALWLCSLAATSSRYSVRSRHPCPASRRRTVSAWGEGCTSHFAQADPTGAPSCR
ncbi:hypothetical protein WJX81_003700 [Elliptochloris bilobata]|uniref:Protein kinase domain-containing protein n=1 Tax=Elliptochloris bilobata TaxID=381761 RepID=A0AAW1RCQ1_9CHLO